ncbi:MAG: exodeoxyribonuclease VII large subunit, partial [Muribaculaceae bacterium]|nr:exodeoxyribonuclease VII large subunit [Muribaculaceae bacterium]
MLTSSTGTQNVWVTAELSDVAVRRGHCYMELLQKDDNGTQVAKARGVIWASNYGQLSREFMAATGQPFATGIKLMVKASATMHPVFGLSLVITGLDPNYTMGDLLRRRR